MGYFLLKNKNENKNGFTLVELLIGVLLFSVIITIVIRIFLGSIQGQRRSLAFETISEQSSFLMEYMSRSLRMAKKELDCAVPSGNPNTCSCLKELGYGYNYELTRGGKGVKFINSQNECQEFFLDDNSDRLKEAKGQQEQFLTGNDTQVVAFGIRLTGEGQDDLLQPRLTFSLSLQNKSQKQESQQILRLQTTVSQRKVDVRY